MSKVRTQDTLLTQTFDLTMLGVILTALFFVVNKRIDGQSVLIICGFLACTFLWNLISEFRTVQKYKWWQAFSFSMIGIFSWWLIYAAENTRAGWYRHNALFPRIQSIVREAPAYIVLSDDDGYITATSKNINVLTGYRPEELVGQQLSVLMRDGPAAKHQIAYDKAINKLRSISEPDTSSGWMLQGLVVVGVKHKDGHIVPVKAYAGGIRWSTDVQFKGDTDLFAVLVPATIEEASKGNSTVKLHHEEIIRESPQPPPINTVSPVPSPVVVPKPVQ